MASSSTSLDLPTPPLKLEGLQKPVYDRPDVIIQPNMSIINKFIPSPSENEEVVYSSKMSSNYLRTSNYFGKDMNTASDYYTNHNSAAYSKEQRIPVIQSK